MQQMRGTVSIGGADVVGLMAGCVVWVRTGSRDWRDRWHQTQRKLGLGADAVQEIGWITVYEVWGAPEALAALTSGEFKCVVRWEYAVAGGHTLRASGSGETGKRKPLLPGERYNQ